MVTAVCVLRSGGEYASRHVDWLRRQMTSHLSGYRLVCLTDMLVTYDVMKLRHGRPGWWSKLEICGPWISGDVLYFDLDTVIVDDIRDLARVGRSTGLRDFYVPDRLQSSVMYLTAEDRAKVWSAWKQDADGWMERCAAGGDQVMFGELLPNCQRWQDVMPGVFVSYKCDIRDRELPSPPSGARVVVFHGQPRPWGIEAEWVPAL